MRRSRRIPAAMLMVLLGSTIGAIGRDAFVQGAPAADDLAEVTVTGERPGPRLWRIEHGDHILWILGTLDPLPKRMTWRSTEVDSVIASSELVLPVRTPVHVPGGPIALIRLYFDWRGTQRSPDGRSLREQLPSSLYERFEALKSRYDLHDSKIETLRPMFAAQRLYRAAIDASGLTAGDIVEEAVVRAARKQRVPVREKPIVVENPRALLAQLKATPPGAEIHCLEVTIRRLETDLAAIRQRAAAWAVGNVERLRQLPYPDQRTACWEAIENAPLLKEFADRIREQRFAEAEDALRQHRTVLAMLPIGLLLEPQGVLARFRALGYRVEGP